MNAAARRAAFVERAEKGDLAGLKDMFGRVDINGQLDSGDVDYHHMHLVGQTALHRASHANQVAALRWLLAKGAAVDILDEGGRSALCLAAAKGHEECFTALLQAGAHPNGAPPGRGATSVCRPLTQAIAAGHMRLAQALLQAGAQSTVDHCQALLVSLTRPSLLRSMLEADGPGYASLTALQGTEQLQNTVRRGNGTQRHYMRFIRGQLTLLAYRHSAVLPHSCRLGLRVPSAAFRESPGRIGNASHLSTYMLPTADTSHPTHTMPLLLTNSGIRSLAREGLLPCVPSGKQPSTGEPVMPRPLHLPVLAVAMAVDEAARRIGHPGAVHDQVRRAAALGRYMARQPLLMLRQEQWKVAA